MKYVLMILLFVFDYGQESNRVLFVGDSLSCYTGGWQDIVCDKMYWKHDNISQVGKRTSWMYVQLKKQLKVRADYEHVFIYGGCNDAADVTIPTDSVVRNIQKIVNLCNKYNIDPIVVCGYNPNKVMRKSELQKRYYEIMVKCMNNLKDCKVIIPCQTITKNDSGDGIHLKMSGQIKFANCVLISLQ